MKITEYKKRADKLLEKILVTGNRYRIKGNVAKYSNWSPSTNVKNELK